MNLKNSLSIAAMALISMIGFCGVAAAQSSSSSAIRNGQPNNNPGLAAGLISITGLNNANIIGNTVSDITLQGGGAIAQNGMKRFALSGNTGAAAAPGAKNWNGWVAYSRSNIAYTFAPLNSSGSVDVYLGGVDYTFDNHVVFGVAAAVDRTDVDLNFNGGKLNGRGVTLSPYLGVPINKNLAFDATAGLGRTNIDTTVGAVAGSTRSDRNVGTLGLTYRAIVGDWQFSGRGAFLSVHDKLGAFTLTNGTFVPDGTVNVSQFRFTGQAAYTSGPITPYVGLTYINDVRRPDQAPVGGMAAANDRDAWTPAIGVRFKADNSVYGSIQYSTERGRSEVKNNQFLFNLGIRF